MLKTLFYIPAEIAGYPMFGVGILLAVWAVASVAILAWLAWRQGFNADTWGYVPMLLVVGVVFRWVLPAIREPQGLPIRGYGVMMLLAVVAGTLLSAWRAKRVGVDPDLIFSLAFWMMVPGIIGARAFYIIHFWSEYRPYYTEPGGSLGLLLGHVINLAQGGLVVYGAFFGGMAGLIAFTRKHRLPLLALCDLIGPSMILGLAIGRIGCLMNGCCFGAVCDRPWAISFPPDSPAYVSQVKRGQMYGFTLSDDPDAEPRVLAVDPHSSAEHAGLKPGDRLASINGAALPTSQKAFEELFSAFDRQQELQIQVENRPTMTLPAVVPPEHSLAVHPAQLYSTIDALILCALLLAYDPFRRRDGEILALMMSIYPITRFCIESLRSDEAAVLGTGLSIAQNVSLLLLICAVALWTYILRQPRGLAFARAKKST
jgi:phosphatidylglycerol---prolipoprotein diacylglyceryl transferase